MGLVLVSGLVEGVERVIFIAGGGGLGVRLVEWLVEVVLEQVEFGYA